MTAAGAFAAWAGASVIVLADGRRGLAAGVGLVALGFTVLAWTDGHWLEGAILLAGGAVSVFELVRAGPQEWVAGRLLQGQRAVAVLTAAAGLALALAGASGLAPNGAGLAPYLVGALTAAGALLLPAAEPRGA